MEFGNENVWYLFLSGDEEIPDELSAIKETYIGHVGFISWKALLTLVRSHRDSANASEKDQLIIDEFLEFTKHYQLGKVLSMDAAGMKYFMDVYPIVVKYEEAIFEKFNALLKVIADRIIIGSSGKVEFCNDDVTDCPCIYNGLSIHEWHVTPSSYVYIDIIGKKIGVILIGYQDEKSKNKFIPVWNETYKVQFANDPRLIALRWVEKDDDEYSIKGGYFKIIDGTSGKSFSPDKISEFNGWFYWGYIHDFDVDQLESYPESISIDFQNLTNTFLR